MLVVSGLVLVAVGLRAAAGRRGGLREGRRAALAPGAAGRQHGAGRGVHRTGLLANGGGFLIVPLYLLIFGLTIRQAVGGRFAHHVRGPVIRRAFGWFLIAFGLLFTIDRIITHHG